MRVALDGRSLKDPPDSCTRTVESHARALQAAGHEILVLQDGGAREGAATVPGERRSWARRLRGVACLWTPHNRPAARDDVRHVATIHDANPLGQDDRRRLHRWVRGLKFRAIVRVCLSRSAVIVTDSQFARCELERWFPAARGRIEVVPQVIHQSMRPMAAEARMHHHAAMGVSEGGVVCVCALRRHKNPLALVHAYARLPAALRRRHPLVFAGPDHRMRGEVRRRSMDAGIGRDVHLLGHRSDEELRALYSGAAVFAYPSLLEGFGLPPVEAMACGAPVVSSGRTALGEVLGDGALIVDPEETVAFAGAIERVLRDPDLARGLRARGRSTAARYTPERVAPAVDRVMSRFDPAHRHGAGVC